MKPVMACMKGAGGRAENSLISEDISCGFHEQALPSVHTDRPEMEAASREAEERFIIKQWMAVKPLQGSSKAVHLGNSYPCKNLLRILQEASRPTLESSYNPNSLPLLPIHEFK